MKKITVVLICMLLMTSSVACAETQPYSRVYEPETSFVLATTVAWEADPSAVDVAQAEVRPATALVYVDQALNVTTAEGVSIGALEDYLAQTTATMIPALYIQDEETAAALKAYLSESELGDVFVAASRENRALVKDVAELVPVRGLVDFRSIKSGDEDTLVQIIQETNGSHAKVALLSEELATEDNVRFLQGRLLTVWVETEANTQSLLQQYTNGANGILVKDYQTAYDVLGFFNDDAPSLLRLPMIIGHRGIPSVHVENTIQSFIGAYNAGADSAENDIHLSADRKLFVVHDSSMSRLFNRPDVKEVEELTLEELQAIPYQNDGETGVQAKNNQPAEKSRYGYIDLLPSQRIPELRDVYEMFRDTGLVHDTEIKSKNPQVVQALRNLVEELDNFDELFTITFNTVILDEFYKSWPEISVGALGTEGEAEEDSGNPQYPAFAEIVAAEGAEKALETLYAEIDQWNATFNPNLSFAYELAVVGRHRGLTVWPWTYNKPEQFADAYLKGIYGMTTNFAWWATDYIEDIRAEDVQIAPGEEVPGPVITTKKGEVVECDGLELVVVEGSLDTPGEALAIYRLEQELIVDGQSFGNYYMYSNPFVVTVTA